MILGLKITLIVTGILVGLFLLAVIFRNPIKDRKHLPRMPRGLDVNAGYPHYTEPIEPQKPSEQTNKQR